MSAIKVGIIGGSGLGDALGAKAEGQRHEIDTPFGKPSDAIVAIALHPTNASIVYIATNESVYKTRDRGTTWERMATDLSSYRVLSLALDPQHPATVYAGTMFDAVYKSPDGGQHWMPHNAGLKEHVSVVNQFVFDPRDSETPRKGVRPRSPVDADQNLGL